MVCERTHPTDGQSNETFTNEKALATSLNSNGHLTFVVPTVPLTCTDQAANESRPAPGCLRLTSRERWAEGDANAVPKDLRKAHQAPEHRAKLPIADCGDELVSQALELA